MLNDEQFYNQNKPDICDLLITQLNYSSYSKIYDSVFDLSTNYMRSRAFTYRNLLWADTLVDGFPYEPQDKAAFISRLSLVPIAHKEADAIYDRRTKYLSDLNSTRNVITPLFLFAKSIMELRYVCPDIAHPALSDALLPYGIRSDHQTWVTPSPDRLKILDPIKELNTESIDALYARIFIESLEA